MSKFKFTHDDVTKETIVYKDNEGKTMDIFINTDPKHEGPYDICLHVDENSGDYYNPFVSICLNSEDARRLGEILIYFADVGELPPNFEALQS